MKCEVRESGVDRRWLGREWGEKDGGRGTRTMGIIWSWIVLGMMGMRR